MSRTRYLTNTTSCKVGDVVALLKLNASGRQTAIVIRRYCRSTSFEATGLMAVQYKETRGSNLYYVDYVSIDGGTHIGSPEDYRNSNRLRRELPCVTTYLVYQFILFTDGFTVTRNLSNPKSSASIYILPVSFPPSVSRTTRRIRTVAATDTSVDSSSAILPILNDIKISYLAALDEHTQNGEQVKIFLDCVAFYLITASLPTDLMMLHTVHLSVVAYVPS